MQNKFISNVHCRSFCAACLDLLMYRENYLESVLEHSWICFLCDSSRKYNSESLIQVRQNWPDYELRIFPIAVPRENLYPPEIKDPSMRIFSAFDGISCGNLFKKYNVGNV